MTFTQNIQDTQRISKILNNKPTLPEPLILNVG